MADFAAPIVEWLVSVVAAADAGDLDGFAEVKKSWTGIALNWPPASVYPRNSSFDPEIMNASHSMNQITVKFGVRGTDPDQVTADAMAYMKAIDDAIYAAVGGDAMPRQVSRVFVAQHDYGPLYGEVKGGGMFRFPEMHLLVEVFENL